MDEAERNLAYTCAPSIFLSITTITLNIFVIKFYWKSELTVVPLLYMIIALLDVLTTMGIMHIYPTFLLVKHGISHYTIEVNVMVLTFFLQIGYRCSVFCNLVLAVSRTVMILKPFYRINMKLVRLACILYAVPWIVLYGLNVHEFNGAYAENMYGRDFSLGAGLAHKMAVIFHSEYTYVYSITILLFEMIAFMFPVIIVIITCIIQVITLQRSSQFPTSSNQRHVTFTVLLMSTLFVVCNFPYFGYIAILTYFILTENFEEYFEWASDSNYSVMMVLSAALFPLLNAALNPLIIVSRSSGMRRTFSDSFQRILSWLRPWRE